MTSALQQFAARRDTAATVLDQLALALRDLPGDAGALAGHLSRTAERARAGRFLVLLVGNFSSGKSTLLNALVGEPVLPVKVNPCTAILTELRWGENPRVEVRFRDGTSEALSPTEFVQRYQLRTASEENAGAEVDDRFGVVERAVVQWPLPLLHDGVAILDTPGLDDDDRRTQRTLGSLGEADAVVFVLNATRFLTDLERRTLRKELLPLGLTNLFFPVTMADLLDALSDDPQRDLADLRLRAREHLGPLCFVGDRDRLDERLFLINARGALHARWDRTAGVSRPEPDASALAASGQPAFEAALEKFLVEERGEAQLRHLRVQVRRARDAVVRQSALDRATADASMEELRRRYESLEPRFRELAQIADRVADTTHTFVDRQAVRVWQSLRDELAAAEAALPDAVDGFDLGSVAGLDLLTPRGRERVEKRLHAALEAWLDARVAAWQASLRPQMETALAGLRQELAGDAADFDVLARGIVTDFAGGVVQLPWASGSDEPDPLERWFSVALGAVLLSPGTMAAGWAQGYEGALKGAASRIAVRLGILALGVFLGPIGWAGLALYAVTDAALLVWTGGGQLRRLRRQVADALRGRLIAQADAVQEELLARVREALGPVRDALVATARSEADDVRRLLDATLAERGRARADAATRMARWERAEQAVREAEARLDG
jgi:hypothetical protein